MPNIQYHSSAESAANASDLADFQALSASSGRYPNQALLMALARLFVQNTGPTLWEVEQFQELMLNLTPEADAKTRQELLQLLSSNMHTPTQVLDSLEMTPIQGLPKNEVPDSIPPVDPVPQQQPIYSIARLKDMLPLQISRKMAQVAALAAKRGDRHILRSLLASHLSVTRQFADHLLTNPDGLLLATALRALRMPSTVAHTILLTSEGLESRDLIYVPQMVNSFERLDPEACRKRLKDWESAFSMAQAETIAGKQAATLQPSYLQPGFEVRNFEEVREANERTSDLQRMAG